MQEGILKAVANPPKILWGPFLPTILNMGLQFPIMFICVGAFNLNPIFFMVSVVVGHCFCVLAGMKEPHLSAMIRAFGQANMVSKNLYKQKGNKFEP